MTSRAGALALLVALSACSAGSDPQNVMGNAIDAESNIEDQADDRAEHLDELSGELADQANRVGGAEGRALRNESSADLDAAAAVRAQGDAAGEAAEDRIEAQAGLLNGQN